MRSGDRIEMWEMQRSLTVFILDKHMINAKRNEKLHKISV